MCSSITRSQVCCNLWNADFFISVLNTKLWILMLMISLVYLATFFIFAGVWWGVYLCAPTDGLMAYLFKHQASLLNTTPVVQMFGGILHTSFVYPPCIAGHLRTSQRFFRF